MKAMASEEKNRIPPELETARLRLRAHRAGDFAACAAMWSNPAVTRFIGGKPSPAQRSWERLLIYRGLWQLVGYGYWVVAEKENDLYVGEVGFADFKRDLNAGIDGIPELGWALDPGSQGKGYATEALRAVLEWGDAHLTPPLHTRTVCLIHPENTASLRVAQKLGYLEVGRTIKKGEPEIIFERVQKV